MACAGPGGWRIARSSASLLASKAPMPDVDALVESLLRDLPEEVRRDSGQWIARARESSPAEVERDLLEAARRSRDEFRDAAAVVERIISE